MKRSLMLLALCLISLASLGCGGNGGGADLPVGNPPASSYQVQLLPAQYVAQVPNGQILLYAKVLDGNGIGIPNALVYYTNLSSPFGFLSSTSAPTNGSGLAWVSLGADTFGFATVQVEVNLGYGKVRDRKTVYFTTLNNLVYPAPPPPTLTLTADNMVLFEGPDDTQSTIKARVLDSGGLPVSGAIVTFGADQAYLTSPSATTCSDGSQSCNVVFLTGNVKTTNSNGEASVIIKVSPIGLTSETIVLNITASANNGAANMISLFLQPVTVLSVSLSANPSVLKSGASSEIKAAVLTSVGTPAPNGTTVNFSTGFGSVVPFSQTTGGIATSNYFAPSVDVTSTGTINGTSGGKSGTVSITVTP